ncbi:MAG: hypothetical protein JSW23_09360 [Planctomycetota bacterium]|nr:MAG: hypothetical protein JSW23_09360 [Planctomycetota bacterium]
MLSTDSNNDSRCAELSGSSNLTSKLVPISSPHNYRAVWIVVLLIALLQTFYAAGFIARTSFVVEGNRYFCLFDDAMISMRYADNWANGHGFVWNPGERVEGYTTFLWTAIMGICHLFRLSPTRTCLLVQILGIPILWCCLVATALLARSCRLTPVSACCAVVLVGGFYNLIFFTLFGMETGLLTCLVTFALADSVRCIHEKQGRITPLLWFAPALLVRPDVLPIMLFVLSFLCISVRQGRARLVAGLLAVALVLSIHFLWRYRFYGEWLPNTYYLKATGWPLADRIVVGIRQSFWTAVTLGLPALLAAMVLLRPKRWHFLILGCFTIAVAYQVYVGGDAWPLSRFVLPVSPGLFVLAAQGIDRTVAFFMKRNVITSRLRIQVALTVLCVIATNAINWNHFFLLTRPQTAGDRRMNIRCVLAVEKIAEPDACVAVGYAGVFPYFSRRRCVDLFGKCDSHIARLPAHSEVRRAGHNKHDFNYSLTTYKPDVILHLSAPSIPECFQHYRPIIVEVDDSEIALCVRKDSPKVRAGRVVGWYTFKEHFLEMVNEGRRDF